MKILRSLAYQLAKAEDENLSLRRENYELRQEVLALRTALASVTERKLRKSVSQPSTRLTRRSITSDGTTPSYAQSTKASRLRSCVSTASNNTSTSADSNSSSSSSSPSSPTSTRSTSSSPDPWSSDTHTLTIPGLLKVNGTQCAYQDGELNVMQFGFLNSTASRQHYEVARLDLYPHAGLNALGRFDPWGWGDPSTQTYNASCSKQIEHVGKLQSAGTLHIMSGAEFDDMITRKAIAKRTRLADKEWTEYIGSQLFINHDRLFEILTETLTVAKRCVWRWTRTHRPKELKYLSDIDFGRDRLVSLFHRMPNTTTCKVESLIRLRNLVCHFSGGYQDVRRMDEHVENVQELAVLLLDEENAYHCRALRDRLRAEVERTLEEIETFTMWTALPGAGDMWLKHHSDTVRYAVYELDMGFSHCPHRVLITAAREWASHRRGLDYGWGIPDVEGNTETESIPPHGPSLLSTESKGGLTGNCKQGEAMQLRRRGSFSVESGCSANVLRGKECIGSRRRSVSF